jgi:hypothetical protein
MPSLSPTAKRLPPDFFVETYHVYNNRFDAGILQLKYVGIVPKFGESAIG